MKQDVENDVAFLPQNSLSVKNNKIMNIMVSNGHWL